MKLKELLIKINGVSDPRNKEERTCMDWEVQGLLVIPNNPDRFSYRELYLMQKISGSFIYSSRISVRTIPKERMNQAEINRLKDTDIPFEWENSVYTMSTKSLAANFNQGKNFDFYNSKKDNQFGKL